MDTHDPTTLAALLLAELRVRDDAWYHLATGTLTREQVANLRHRFEPPETLARNLELFGPTSEETNEERLKTLLQRYYPSSGSDTEEPDDGGSSPSDAKIDDEPADSIATLPSPSLHGRRRWWTSAVTAGFALAAVVVLAWAVRPSGETLPQFELVFEHVSTGDMRSPGTPASLTEDGCDARYFEDQSLVARLHPTSRLGDELGLIVLARLIDGEEEGRELWREPPIEQSTQGVLAIDIPMRDLGLVPGTWSLTFYVTSEDHDHEALQALEPGTHPEVTVVRAMVCIEE
ncbi:hypothetical protein [Paraliomyxa miuraensis]|uniref:hypothetical protein n=1 Tax=Paraliomyxa miuraensis TaxID=376150 RepID=UPI0022507158|nr:hypothetical protein [Paraliomyxa miuraensis]MCX4239189.1 hypothetical protein [Paraliomyxa miuraensis]